MITKKFSSFEYAAARTDGLAGGGGNHQQDAFESPYGHVLVMAVNEGTDNGLPALIIERIRYYMHNETEDKQSDVCRNALMYTSGYLFQQSQSGQVRDGQRLSCLCVLVCDDQVHFGAYGEACLWFMAGKSWQTLLFSHPTPGQEYPEKTAAADEAKAVFLGSSALAEPLSNREEFHPITSDLLLMGAGAFCGLADERRIRKILADNMPVQTKVSRITRQLSGAGGETSMACTLLHFYNSSRDARLLPSPIIRSGSKNKATSSHKDMQGKKTQKPGSQNQKSIWKTIKQVLMILVLLFVAYMIYDLIIYDPRPPISLPPAAELSAPSSKADAPDVDELMSGDKPVIPDDIRYAVRSGDTWGRIYLQFGVCSWFIRNHPPNVERFGSRAGLMADVTIRIPVRYSSKPEYNPYYYTEFTTEKVGESCENVNEAFREAFEEMIRRQGP